MLDYTMRKILVGILSFFKYLLAIFMMFAGYATATSPPTPLGGALGFLYSTRASLVAFGVVFFVSGFLLFWGKIRKNRRMTGWGLMAIFYCFLFAGLLNGIATGWVLGAYLGNIIMAFIVGALYLRWRLKFFYIDIPD